MNGTLIVAVASATNVLPVQADQVPSCAEPDRPRGARLDDQRARQEAFAEGGAAAAVYCSERRISRDANCADASTRRGTNETSFEPGRPTSRSADPSRSTSPMASEAIPKSAVTVATGSRSSNRTLPAANGPREDRDRVREEALHDIEGEVRLSIPRHITGRQREAQVRAGRSADQPRVGGQRHPGCGIHCERAEEDHGHVGEGEPVGDVVRAVPVEIGDRQVEREGPGQERHPPAAGRAGRIRRSPRRRR